jgi:hypothetical protein
MRILPRGLGFFFCFQDGRAGIMAWDAAGIEAGRVRWRSELVGLFEDDSFMLVGGGRG